MGSGHMGPPRKQVDATESIIFPPTTFAGDNPVICVYRYLIKRAQGRRKFGLKNFKRRYFCLTNHSLIYAKGKGKEPTCSPFSVRVRLYWGESDIASRWIHRGSFTLSFNKKRIFLRSLLLLNVDIRLDSL